MSPRIQEIAKEWLRRAQSNFVRATLTKPDEVYFEDLCFDAQQAAEKALKAIFVLHGKKFPFTHDIGVLICELESFIDNIPAPVRESVLLNDYAVMTRYPNWGAKVTEGEYRAAVALAKIVLNFAEEEFK